MYCYFLLRRRSPLRDSGAVVAGSVHGASVQSARGEPASVRSRVVGLAVVGPHCWHGHPRELEWSATVLPPDGAVLREGDEPKSIINVYYIFVLF